MLRLQDNSPHPRSPLDFMVSGRIKDRPDMAKKVAVKSTSGKSPAKVARGAPSVGKTPGGAKAAATARKTHAIDTDLIRAIAELLTETNVGEIQVAKGDLKVRVSRYGGAPMQMAPMMAPAVVAQPAIAAATAFEKTIPSKAADAASHPGAVKSPMVGTAYRRASPEAKNFVEVGSHVKAGDKLMLIEAMKTFNDITAPSAGTVTAIFIEDAQPVEFGQTLFVIE
jgi:acetyl-CoA carboxylase biotin carboxyl carrier protein